MGEEPAEAVGEVSVEALGRPPGRWRLSPVSVFSSDVILIAHNYLNYLAELRLWARASISGITGSDC